MITYNKTHANKNRDNKITLIIKSIAIVIGPRGTRTRKAPRGTRPSVSIRISQHYHYHY